MAFLPRMQGAGREERPREKLLGKGTRNLDVLALAEKLISIIDQKRFRLAPEDLKQLKGIGDAKAAIILPAIEFARRRIKPEGYKVKSPGDIYPHIRHYADRKQEHFLCATINGANEVINIRVVSIGLVDTIQVHPREVFADPLTDRASGVIVANNHPSGDLFPSKNDISVTKRLLEAEKLLGIRVLDHVILNRQAYYSFKKTRC